MNVHQKLMIGFTVIAERLLSDNRASDNPKHPAQIMVDAMNCLLANEFEGNTIDETFEAFKLADAKEKEEMFEVALHFVGMSLAHIEAFVERFADEEEDEPEQNPIEELKGLLDKTGLSMN
tara:strand:- start:317 stop:679 length:363 start_codon:yes stop_codon:yes gene_type:complete